MAYSDELLRDTMLTEEGILADLEELSLYYDDMKVESRVIPALEDAPLPTLAAALETDEKGRVRLLTHSFLTLGKEDAEFTKYLQFYMELRNPVEGIDRAVLLEALCRLNAILPMGSCFLVPARPELELPALAALRAVQGGPLNLPIDQGVFTEDVFLFDLSCELVSRVLDALGEGASLDEAMAALTQ